MRRIAKKCNLTFKDLVMYLPANGNEKKICNNTTARISGNHRDFLVVSIDFHGHTIGYLTENYIELNSHGYTEKVTKDRLNMILGDNALPLIQQVKGLWIVNGQEFYDGKGFFLPDQKEVSDSGSLLRLLRGFACNHGRHVIDVHGGTGIAKTWDSVSLSMRMVALEILRVNWQPLSDFYSEVFENDIGLGDCKLVDLDGIMIETLFYALLSDSTR